LEDDTVWTVPFLSGSPHFLVTFIHASHMDHVKATNVADHR